MQEVTLKDINKLAVPAIFAGISEPIISLADTAIIGHLSTEALGAVGIGSSLFLIIVWVLGQIKSATSAIVSQNFGANKVSEIKTLIPQSIFLAMVIGILFFLLTYPFQYEIFSMYNAKGNLLQLAVDYYGIRAIGFPITLATFTVFGVFRGFQNTTWAMFISIGGGILNIILDFALIFGIEGIISPMGVKGAALASLLSQCAMLTSALVVLKIKLPHSFEFSLVPNKHLSPLVSMTSNLFIRTMALNITYYLGNSFATGYGNEYIAAHTIAMNIWLFSAFFIDGYANAGNAISGKLLGQNNIGALYKTGIKIIKISVLISLILSAVYILLYNIIGMAFTDDKVVRTIFYSIFWMVILTQPINAIAFTLDGIFKGLAKAKLLRNVLLLSTFLVFIPTIYLTDMANINLYAVWLAFLVWMMARSGCLFYYFRKRYNCSARMLS